MPSAHPKRLQFETLESIVALSGVAATLHRPAAEVAATPTSLPLSGTLRGPAEYAIGIDPSGPVSLVLSPSATVGGASRGGAVAGHLAPLGRARLTGELTWNSPASDRPAGSGRDMVVLWSRFGPTYLSVQRPATPPTPGSSATFRYEVIQGMSGPRPTFYAPGSGTITLTLSHAHPGRRGIGHTTATLSFTPDPAAAPMLR